MASNSKTAQEWFEQGNEAFDRNDWDTAIESYTESIRLKPDYANSYYNFAASTRKQRQH